MAESKHADILNALSEMQGSLHYAARRGILAAAERLIREQEQKIKQIEEKQDLAFAMAHVTVEAGVVPGITTPCRCDECRQVAVSMDAAGYLDRITDRWWDTEHRPAPPAHGLGEDG